MKGLAILSFLVLFLIQIAVLYVAVPYVLMQVLIFLGVDISFWLCVGICWLVYFFVNFFKRKA